MCVINVSNPQLLQPTVVLSLPCGGLCNPILADLGSWSPAWYSHELISNLCKSNYLPCADIYKLMSGDILHQLIKEVQRPSCYMGQWILWKDLWEEACWEDYGWDWSLLSLLKYLIIIVKTHMVAIALLLFCLSLDSIVSIKVDTSSNEPVMAQNGLWRCTILGLHWSFTCREPGELDYHKPTHSAKSCFLYAFCRSIHVSFYMYIEWLCKVCAP